MSKKLNIFVSQMNPTVGAVKANAEGIAATYAEGLAAGADLVVTPELSLVGYPPEDLVLKPFFVREARRAAEALAGLTEDNSDPGLLIGLPWEKDGQLYNAVLLLAEGCIKDVRYKRELPNYGVFDEKRVFQAAPSVEPVHFRGFCLGIMVCEDMWRTGVTAALDMMGAQAFIVVNASPYEAEKDNMRWAEAQARVGETAKPLLFCNQVGGQDELVFDGAGFALNADGQMIFRQPSWVSDARMIVLEKNTDTASADTGTGNMVAGIAALSFSKSDTGAFFHQTELAPVSDGLEAVYSATVLALRDYVRKNGFPGVLLGLSGGIDSALSAAIAVDALGAEQVHGVMMPSRYTSKESLEDAKACANMLGIRYDSISIGDAVDAFGGMLKGLFEGQAPDTLDTPDTTEENLQSRVRAVTLMALSNKFGKMLLTTGNKSEMSVGYATLYGDMCGGYNALKDVYKLDVFGLSRWRNDLKIVPDLYEGQAGPVMPVNIITKPPTAELRENQRDEDSLPPYERLDAILKGLVDREASVAELVEEGFDLAEVTRIEQLLYVAEYKRRQAPPGVKITNKNFGRDRRYPITNGFRSARRKKKA